MRFSITDTGAGIGDSEIKKVFEPFAQGLHPLSGISGNGLGLGIAQTLVSAMGGQLNVVSTPGQGSAFHFALKFLTADEADIALPTETFRFPAPFGRGKTVLIADRQEPMRDYLAEVLHTANFDVVKASCATELLQYLQETTFDVVITEQFFADVPVALLPRKLLALGKALPALILCSASPCQSPDDWQKLAPLVLLKPLKAAGLLEAVGALVG